MNRKQVNMLDYYHKFYHACVRFVMLDQYHLVIVNSTVLLFDSQFQILNFKLQCQIVRTTNVLKVVNSNQGGEGKTHPRPIAMPTNPSDEQTECLFTNSQYPQPQPQTFPILFTLSLHCSNFFLQPFYAVISLNLIEDVSHKVNLPPLLLQTCISGFFVQQMGSPGIYQFFFPICLFFYFVSEIGLSMTEESTPFLLKAVYFRLNMQSKPSRYVVSLQSFSSMIFLSICKKKKGLQL